MKDFIMKKFLVLSLLIHASIICSSSSSGEEVKYIGPKILINLIDKATANIPKEKYREIYQGCCNKKTCYGELVQDSMEKLFNLGKEFQSKYTDKLTTKNEQLKIKFRNKSLIECLNSYSKPAKIGFGIAAILVVTSLVYSGRQLYLFSKQKYSNWKAKKEESES